MPSFIPIQLLLMALICCCWQTQICGPKKIFTFYGQISPFEQQLFKKHEKVLKRTKSVLGRMFSSKEKPGYLPTDETVPITWIVEIVECDGCDIKYGPKRPSFIAKNGVFYIPLLPESDEENGIKKLIVKIKSAEEIPMRKSSDEDGDMHREFKWTIWNPKFDIIHHFQFGHFRRRSGDNDEGIYLKMGFINLPMFENAENRKEFVKYSIIVERERDPKDKVLNVGKWEKISEERELSAEEIKTGKPFKFELVKNSELGSKLEPRLLKPRPMLITVKQKPVCGICGNVKKDGSITILKLSNCNNLWTFPYLQNCGDDLAPKNLSNAVKSTHGEENEYKCPICGKMMNVKTDIDGNKEKNKAIFDNSDSQIKLKTFVEFHLEMPILQNGDDPEYIYKFDYNDKSGKTHAGKDNYHNAVDMGKKKEDSKIILAKLIEGLLSDWPPPIRAQLIREGIVPPPPPPQHNVDSSGGASSSQPKSNSDKKMKGIIHENPQNPPPPQQHSTKEIKGPSGKDKASSSSVKIEEINEPAESAANESGFKNSLNKIINIVVNPNIINEEKMANIEKEYEKWEEKHGRKISLNRLCNQIVQIQELDLKSWTDAVRNKVNEHIVEMQSKIVEMIALKWLREQRNLKPEKVDKILQTVDSYLKEREQKQLLREVIEVFGQLLKDGLNKKTTNAFENFVKKYAGIKKDEDRWTEMVNWANFMGPEELYHQIALAHEYEGKLMNWLNAIVSHGEVHTIIIELKKHLEMAVIHEIFRRGHFQYKNQDSSKFMKELNEHEHAYGLDKSEQEKLLQIVGIACVEPQNHKTYLGVYGSNHKVNELFWDYAKKYNEVLGGIWLSVDYVPPEHY